MKFKPLHDRVVVERKIDEEKTKDSMVIVDRGYFREQANEALKTFVAPLSGIYAAAFGPVSLPGDNEPPQKTKGSD